MNRKVRIHHVANMPVSKDIVSRIPSSISGWLRRLGKLQAFQDANPQGNARNRMHIPRKKRIISDKTIAYTTTPLPKKCPINLPSDSPQKFTKQLAQIEERITWPVQVHRTQSTAFVKMDLQLQIADLTKTNDIPSNAVLDEVKHLLQRPSEDVDNLDVEILALAKRLEDLKSRRDEAQKGMVPYQSILSPIRRVPTDILCEIFQHCLPSHRNPVIKTTECPMLLTHICRKWRALAINDSRLWSGLYTTFSDDDMVALDEESLSPALLPLAFLGTLSRETRDGATQILQRRIDAVKEWTSRSGTRPLSISIRFTTNFIRDAPHSDSNSMTLRFFELLVSLSPRFEVLEVKMPIKIYRVFERLMKISEIKALKTFRADLYSQMLNSREDGWAEPVAFLHAPNLRQLSMFGHGIRIWGTEDPSYGWSRLTHISIHHPVHSSEMVRFLENSSNLVHFQASITEDIDDINNVGAALQYQRTISLPFIRTLHIFDDVDPRRTGNLYDTIEAPLLHWFAYHGRFRPHIFTANDLPPIPILSFLRRSTSIRRLNIDSHDNTQWGMGRIFRAVPHVTHLIIGRETRSSKGYLQRTAPVYMSPRLRKVPWDIGGLLVDAVPRENPLLPNLKILEVSSHTGYFSDEKLKNFFISRLNPSPSQGVTNLKRVEILFYREQETDIGNEVLRHADVVKTRVSLVLNYIKKLDDQPRSCAPSFGLQEPDGRSWCHPEFAETYRGNND